MTSLGLEGGRHRTHRDPERQGGNSGVKGRTCRPQAFLPFLAPKCLPWSPVGDGARCTPVLLMRPAFSSLLVCRKPESISHLDTVMYFRKDSFSYALLLKFSQLKAVGRPVAYFIYVCVCVCMHSSMWVQVNMCTCGGQRSTLGASPCPPPCPIQAPLLFTTNMAG